MKVKLITIILFIFAVNCFTGVVYAVSEGTNNTLNSSGIALSPPYYDLGNIGDGEKSFTAKIRNNIADADLEAKVENKGNEHITISPNKFFLKKNETKDITISLKNDADLEIGPYDLSIYFVIIPKGNISINASSTNSLRLVFLKPGLSVVSCNVGDIGAVQTNPFYIIMGNFSNTYKDMDTTITITSEKSGTLIYSYNYSIPINAYPKTKYYGTVKLPLPSKPWEFGDYIFHMTAKDDNSAILTYDKTFNVGVMKGLLEKIETKNVGKGEPASFIAVVKNIGNQNLPVTVKIIVKDKSDNTVYEQTKFDTLSQGITKDFLFDWPTKHSETGKYSIDYSVRLGNDEKTDRLYFKITPSNKCIYIIIICSVILIILIIIFLIILRCRCKRKQKV